MALGKGYSWLQGHIPGSSNVEMYRQIKEWDIKSTLKRVQLAAFGIYPGVEENPEFIEQMKLVAKPGRKMRISYHSRQICIARAHFVLLCVYLDAMPEYIEQ